MKWNKSHIAAYNTYCHLAEVLKTVHTSTTSTLCSRTSSQVYPVHLRPQTRALNAALCGRRPCDCRSPTAVYHRYATLVVASAAASERATSENAPVRLISSGAGRLRRRLGSTAAPTAAPRHAPTLAVGPAADARPGRPPPVTLSQQEGEVVPPPAPWGRLRQDRLQGKQCSN